MTTLTYTVTVNADAFNQTLGNVATPGPGGECVTRLRHRPPDPGLHADQDLRPGRRVDGQPGDTVTYTLTVTNDSDGVVTGAVTDDLSDVLDNATIGTIAPAASLTGTTLTWTVPSWTRCGDDPVYTVTVNADAFNQTLGNVATPGPGGECLTDCDTEHPTPGYTLTKTSDPADGATVQPG